MLPIEYTAPITVQLALFDYGALDAETRTVVLREDHEYDRQIDESGASFVCACHALRRIQEALKYKRPGFVDYCRSKPGLSTATAYRMIDVARMFPESGNIGVGSREALYLLASPSTPDDARVEAIDRVRAGESLTFGIAREIIRDHSTPFVEETDPDAPDPDDISPEDIYQFEYEQARGAQMAGWAVPLPEPPQAIQPTRDQHIMAVMGSSASPEWYTPPEIVDRVLDVLGAIDLDPCSNSHTDPTVPAAARFTAEDDGLARVWTGRLYMNPPYGDEIPPWVIKLVDSYVAGLVTEAIALVPGRIDTAWFQPLYAYPMCHVRGRLRFRNAENSAPFPSILVYLGSNEDRFIEIFRALGPIMRRVA